MTEAGQIGFIDSLLQLDALREEEHGRARFEAALHGKELRS